VRPDTVVAVVTRVYAAAGRRAGEVDFEVWGEAMATLDDELVVEASRCLVREVDLAAYPPSPAQLIQLYRRLARQRPGLPPAEEPATSPDAAQEWIGRLRRLLNEHPIKRPEDGGRC
jgi:hypothetical protein